MIFNLGSGENSAENTIYNNSESGLVSNTVQGAIDEVNSTKSPLAGSSSLTTCSKGNFGTAAAANTTTSIASGGTGLPTAGTVYTALGKKSNVISQASVSADNITVTTTDVKNGTISATKSGYTPVCIVGYNLANATTSGTGSSYCLPIGLYLSGTTVNYRLSNMYTSNIKVKLTVYVLYVKD